MDFPKLDQDLTQMRERNRRQGLALGALIAALLLCLGVIFKLAGSGRTVLVPPVIDRTFWVARDHAGREYLEEMGGFIAWLILDVTPASIDWKKDVLLNYLAPERHGAMKLRQELEAERLKRLNAATFFLPQQLVADETKQTVVLRGRLRTLVNGQQTAEETRSYLARFEFSGGRIHLQSFQEISP